MPGSRGSREKSIKLSTAEEKTRKFTFHAQEQSSQQT